MSEEISIPEKRSKRGRKVGANGKEVRKKKRISRGFTTRIYKVLKQVHPDTSIKKSSLSQVNFIVEELGKRLVTESFRLITELRNSEKKTISSREIQAAVRLTLPGELAKHAVSEATKAVTKFTSAREGPRPGVRAPRVRRETRAGLVFSVGRSAKLIRIYKVRVAVGAPVYLAAVLEYITAEILELAGNSARDRKRTRIGSKDLNNAIYFDEELRTLLEELNIQLIGNNTQTVMYDALIPKTKKEKKEAKKEAKREKIEKKEAKEQAKKEKEELDKIAKTEKEATLASKAIRVTSNKSSKPKNKLKVVRKQK